MPQYIDKDPLIEKLKARHEDLVRDYGDYDNYVMGFQDAIELLENAPVADVQEVKHAKDLEATVPFGGGSFKCSNCHFYDDDTYTIDTEIGRIKYCPNCGAKIDLEDDK